MDRITVKLQRDTHTRLVRSLPGLSAQAGEMLTISGAIDYMLAALRPVETLAAAIEGQAARAIEGQADAEA